MIKCEKAHTKLRRRNGIAKNRRTERKKKKQETKHKTQRPIETK